MLWNVQLIQIWPFLFASLSTMLSLSESDIDWYISWQIILQSRLETDQVVLSPIKIWIYFTDVKNIELLYYCSEHYPSGCPLLVARCIMKPITWLVQSKKRTDKNTTACAGRCLCRKFSTGSAASVSLMGYGRIVIPLCRWLFAHQVVITRMQGACWDKQTNGGPVTLSESRHHYLVT